MRQPSALNGVAGDGWIQIQVSNAVATCVSRNFCARHSGMKLQYIYRQCDFTLYDTAIWVHSERFKQTKMQI